MKQLHFLAGFLCGVILLGGGTAYAMGVMAERSTQQVYVDGQAVQVEAYNIDGYNYIKLRDVGELVDFNVYWDGASVRIESEKAYTGLPPVQQTASDAIPGDRVAEALFDIILKDDASSIVALFGYANEAEARRDMGLENGLYDELVNELVSQFSAMGITVTAEDTQKFVDAFLTMFKNVELTAKVKQSDEKAGTAVITCTINTFDANAMTDAVAQAVEAVMSDPNIQLDSEDALYSALLGKMSEAIASLTPTENTRDFDVNFVLEEQTVNGKNRKVWLPEDANAFGAAISTAAMGG